ncbi:hypothetical protein [Rodentibacter caecimuris]|uniref:Porin domain-containing protein n=1 Tax=Rodentibacter caecimuris TaxID=1796644 RepID=A0ABX3KZF3_9PAST|nr:hypothetical protein BKG89_01460 [Rodentibacter heylii]
MGVDYASAKSPKGHSDHTFRVGKAKFEKLDQFELGLKYQFTKANKVYGEYLWGIGKTDNQENAKFHGWFLGEDHKFNDAVLVYVEGGSFNTK